MNAATPYICESPHEYERRLVNYAKSKQWCDFIICLRMNLDQHGERCNSIPRDFTETIIEQMLNCDTPQCAVDAFLSSCHSNDNGRFLRAVCKLGASIDVVQPLLSIQTTCEKMKDQLGRNPLIHYVICGTKASDPNVLTQLLAAFPYLPTLQDNEGLTALHWALRKPGQYWVTEQILDVSPESAAIRDIRGEVPLHVYCRGNVKSLRLLSKILICYPAGVLEENQFGVTPLQILWNEFAKTDASQLSEGFLLRDSSTTSATVSPQPLIMDDVVTTFTSRVKMLLLVATTGTLELHAPKTPAERKWSMLNAAAQIGQKCPSALFEFFLFFHFGHPMKCDEEGMLPIHIIAGSAPQRDELGETYMKKVLRNFSESASVADRNGMIPLHIAAAQKDGNGSILRALIAAYPEGARMVDKSGRLPIHHAIRNGQRWKDNMQILFDAYPLSLTTPDKNTGLYPFMLAACSDSCSFDVTFHLLRADPSFVKGAVPETKSDNKRKITVLDEVFEDTRSEIEDESRRKIRLFP